MLFNTQTKVAITGHTKGIGQAIASSFESKGCQVIGMSRSNGFDLNQKESIQRAVKAAEPCSIFINNAYCGWNQIDLLFEVFRAWKDTTKAIVNISSNSSDGEKNYVHEYAVVKAALDKACLQLNNISDSKCRVLNVRPGWVDTDLNRHLNLDIQKLEPKDVANTVIWLLEQPKHVHVSTITLLPR